MLGKILKGRYQVTQILSSGGWCQTYLGKDISFADQPPCVIKQLLPAPGHAKNLSSLRRLFTREAAALEQLGNYPQVPQLLAHFEDNQQFYLVQEFIAGQPLSAELQPGRRWRERQVIELLQEVLSILEVVHANGLIHRDLKPSNLIRRESDLRLVLIDFGSVKQAWTQVVTSQGQTNANFAIGLPATIAVGTSGYMPTEQSRGRPRPNSDIYALGIIGIQAVTGMHPTVLLEDAETGELLWQNYASINPDLVAVLNQMVRYHFQDRYQSATEVLQALQPLSKVYTRSPLTATAGAKAPAAKLSGRDAAVIEEEPRTVAVANTDQATSSSLPNNSVLVLGIVMGAVSALGLLLLSYYTLRPVDPQPQESQYPVAIATSSPTLTQTLTAHAGAVWALAVSPNGQTLASGSGDKTVKLWDLPTRELRRTLLGNSAYVLSVALSPDDQTLASGSYATENAIKVWNLPTGKLRSFLFGNSSQVWSVAISPDGQTLVSSGDRNIKIWDLNTGKLRRTLTGHSDTVWSIAISPDGQTLASGSRDRTVKIWDLNTGELRRTLTGHSDRVRSVAISSDGQNLVSGSWDQTIKIWYLPTGKLLHTLTGHSGYINSVAVSPNGEIIASGSDDRTIKLWHLPTGKLLHTLSGHTSNVNTVTFDSIGKTLVSGSADRTIKIWQL